MSVDLGKDDGMLAAEYAMGLLNGAELAEVERRVASDQMFARQVTEWEIDLAGLAADLPEVAPSAAAKTAIMGTLFPEETQRVGVWQRLGLWQALSAISALALAVLVFTTFLGSPDVAGPLYTAEIISQEGDFRVVAVVDKTRNEVIMTRTAGAAPDGRILQVWAHGEDAPAISVGLWPDGETVRLPMPPVIAAVEGILTLGVSEEPPGGSLTGSPSGRVFGTVDIPGVTMAF